MSQEKIRNYKQLSGQAPPADSIPSFLLKTYEILENSKYCDIICWTKNGQGFVVKRVKEFAETILPTHFRHSNYTSFVRQLNMYDFHKTRQQNQENAFKNSMFRRGHKHLLKQIERKDYKKKKQRPENYQKAGALLLSNQYEQGPSTRPDKKVEEIKQQHRKVQGDLQLILEQLQSKQTQLSRIEGSYDFQNQEQVCEIMDKLFSCKNFNNNLWIRMFQVSRSWDNLLLSKQKSLKTETSLINTTMEIKSQNTLLKREQQPTFETIKSFGYHKEVSELNNF